MSRHIKQPPRNPATPRRQLGGASRSGLPSGGASSEAIQEFLAVPGTEGPKVAKALDQLVAGTGVTGLDVSERNQLSLQVDQMALDVAEDVAEALEEAPEETGVKPERILRREAQRMELSRVDRALEVAEEMVQDGKRVVETWQARARAKIGTQIFTDLQDERIPLAERQQLVVDADEVLSLEEELLLLAIQTLKDNATGRQMAESEAQQMERLLQLQQAMRDTREGKRVPKSMLRALALYYADLLSEGQGPPPKKDHRQQQRQHPGLTPAP